MTEQKALLRSDYKPLDFTIVNTNLEVSLDLPLTTVKSKLELKQLNPEATSFTLNGQKLNLVSLKVNGEDFPHYTLTQLPGVQGFQDLTLDVSSLADKSSFILEIENTFNLEANKSLAGIYKAGDVICSQCEAAGFRQITFYFDRPDCLAVFTVKVIADKKYTYLLSNGNKIAEGDLENGKHFCEWNDPFPKPCYLFALVAGQFDVIRDHFITKSGRDVKLEIFAEPGKGSQLHFAMDALKRSMKWDEDRFNLEYDLDLFMIVAVSFFNMGAMENKGLNIFNDAYLIGDKDTVHDSDLDNIDRVVAHEYFHNWTGDRVTCRDWFQLTLKEGLTVFRDQEYTSDTTERTVKRIKDSLLVQTVQFNEDMGPMAHPIRPEKVLSQDNFYTVTVYEKGAEVIRMIHTILGEENFQKGMALYFERHDGKAVTCDDFVDAMQDASGIDLTDFKRWYSQSGTPVVDVVTNYNPETKVYHVEFKQHTPATNDQKEKVPLHLVLKTHLLDQTGKRLTGLKLTNGEDLPELVQFATESYSLEVANVAEEPILVTNLDFSSPVKLNVDYSTKELALIATNSENLYGRAVSVRNLYTKLIEDLVKNYQEGEEVQLSPEFKDLLNHLLDESLSRPNFVATILNPPALNEYISTLNANVDPLRIQTVFKALRTKLAQEFGEKAKQVYLQIPKQAYQYTTEQIGFRSLRLRLLQLMTYGNTNYKDLVEELYFTADNQTDRENALNVAVANEQGLTNLEQDFVARSQDNVSAMDTYTSAKAIKAKSFAELQEVLHANPFFDETNPNRIYTKIRGLANNLDLFYNPDGSGYKFAVEEVVAKDKFNPQLSSVIVRTLLLPCYKLAEPYYSIAQNALQELAGKELSNNASELVNKALDMAKNKA